MTTGIELFLASGATLAAAVTAYYQGRKTATASELESVSQAIKIWRETSEGLQQEVIDAKQERAQSEANHKADIAQFKMDAARAKMECDAANAKVTLELKNLTEMQNTMAEAMRKMQKIKR